MATPDFAKYLTTLHFPIQGQIQEHSATQKESPCRQERPNNPSAIQKGEKSQPAQQVSSDLYQIPAISGKF